MSLLAVKLILTPILIGVATVAARRWGPVVGGWVAGLPLTSGPVSVFLAIEQGRGFAAQAARATLLGLIAVGAFCVTYSRTARNRAWKTCTALALAVYLLMTWALSFVSVSLVVETLLVFVLLYIALSAAGLLISEAFGVRAPWWDLPLRMATATAIVLLITGGAEYVGPKWSGLLSPFPVFACVMAIFSHRHNGAMAARQLLRGVIIGSFAFASFFAIVAFGIERMGLPFTYCIASGVALAVNGLSLVGLVRDQHAC